VIKYEDREDGRLHEDLWHLSRFVVILGRSRRRRVLRRIGFCSQQIRACRVTHASADISRFPLFAIYPALSVVSF
jgi:hypothetical protein